MALTLKTRPMGEHFAGWINLFHNVVWWGPNEIGLHDLLQICVPGTDNDHTGVVIEWFDDETGVWWPVSYDCAAPAELVR